MDISIINDFIAPLALVAALCVGWIIKNLIPSDKANNFIPLIAALVGVAVVGLSDGWSVNGVVIGMTSGLASTGMYEAFSQIVKFRDFSLLEKNEEDCRDLEEIEEMAV